MSFRIFASGSLAFAVAATLVWACSSKAELGGEGASCELATDCQEGLVCVPQKSGSSQCSNNLGSIQQLPGTPDAGTAATGDASGDSATIPPNNDGGPPPVVDSGTPVKDTGTPDKDAGAPVVDTGAPSEDAGAPAGDDASGD